MSPGLGKALLGGLLTVLCAGLALAAVASQATTVFRVPTTADGTAADLAPDPLGPPLDLAPQAPGGAVTTPPATIDGTNAAVPVRLEVLERPIGALAEPALRVNGADAGMAGLAPPGATLAGTHAGTRATPGANGASETDRTTASLGNPDAGEPGQPGKAILRWRD